MLLTMCSALSSAIPLVVQEMKKHIRFGSQQILEMQKGLHLELWNVNPISTSADCGVSLVSFVLSPSPSFVKSPLI